MSATIFKHEFRMHLRSVLIWSAGIAALLLLYLSLFPSFAEQAELVNEMMANFPKELLMAFGMTDINLASVLGYFSFTFLFAQICLAVQAAHYGFGLVSVEEREMTADFLLTRPVTRTQILTSKLLAVLLNLLVTDAILWACSLLFLTLFNGGQDYERGTLLLLLFSVVIFQLFFLTVGVAISLLVRRVRSVTPYAMALAFGMYMLSAFSDLLGESKLELLTPFKHFSATQIVRDSAYDLPLVMISVVVIVVSVVASYILYLRRDIPSVT